MPLTQKHLRWITLAPASSNSCLVIHIVWKVERVAWIDPPSQLEYLRSSFSMIFVRWFGGTKAFISRQRRYEMFGKRVLPPARKMCLKKSRLIASSHFITES